MSSTHVCDEFVKLLWLSLYLRLEEQNKDEAVIVSQFLQLCGRFKIMLFVSSDIIFDF